MNLHRTHLNIANKLLVVSRLFPVEFQQCQWVGHKTHVGYTVFHSKLVMFTVLLSPQTNSICFLLFPSKVLTPMPSVANQIRILPNNRARWEVRWKRDGLLTVRRTGN